MIEQRSYITFQPFIERLLASDGATLFEAGRARGRALSRRVALDLALGPASTTASTRSSM
jgi:hypothetical protein